MGRLARWVNLRVVVPPLTLLAAALLPAAHRALGARSGWSLSWLLAAVLGGGLAWAVLLAVGSAVAVVAARRAGARPLAQADPELEAILRAEVARGAVWVGDGPATATAGLPGLGHAVLLAPCDAAGPERRRAVLLHELGHVARRDPLRRALHAGLFAAAHGFFLVFAVVAAARSGDLARAFAQARALVPGLAVGGAGGAGAGVLAGVLAGLGVLVAAAMLMLAGALQRQWAHEQEHAADRWAAERGAGLRPVLEGVPAAPAPFPFADHPSPARRVERLDSGAFGDADAARSSLTALALLGVAPVLLLNLLAAGVVTSAIGRVADALGPVSGDVGELHQRLNALADDLERSRGELDAGRRSVVGATGGARDAVGRLGTAAGAARDSVLQVGGAADAARGDLARLGGAASGAQAALDDALRVRLGWDGSRFGDEGPVATLARSVEASRTGLRDALVDGIGVPLEGSAAPPATAPLVALGREAGDYAQQVRAQRQKLEPVLREVVERATRVRDALGDPAAAGGRSCVGLGDAELARLAPGELSRCIHELEVAIAVERARQLRTVRASAPAPTPASGSDPAH